METYETVPNNNRIPMAKVKAIIMAFGVRYWCVRLCEDICEELDEAIQEADRPKTTKTM